MHDHLTAEMRMDIVFVTMALLAAKHMPLAAGAARSLHADYAPICEQGYLITGAPSWGMHPLSCLIRAMLAIFKSDEDMPS